MTLTQLVQQELIVRDLHTQLKVSIHSIESISERIESLRDQELLPQILELLRGYARMWKVTAECHQIQKRTLDEAKRLLAATMPCNHHHNKISTERLARSALNLVAQVLNWRACFQALITSQRSYVLFLTDWLLRRDPDPEKVTLSTYPQVIYEVCIGWSRLGLNEKHVLDKLDFFASWMGSLFALKLKEEPYSGTRESMELVEVDKVESWLRLQLK
ncbi:hypothetical protein Bca52824_012631 [Brassica carinata]|uniref:DUF632 domain-containing protein n=1 Tax=Brassica carinata TaxID=52824 RepID=A0A8X8B2J9_BRACI|nr:hypothetical protein Bca52824_012631 [Brassica carinata]